MIWPTSAKKFSSFLTVKWIAIALQQTTDFYCKNVNKEIITINLIVTERRGNTTKTTATIHIAELTPVLPTFETVYSSFPPENELLDTDTHVSTKVLRRFQ